MPKRLLLFTVLIALAAGPLQAAPILYVVSYRDASVSAYDAETGEARGVVVPPRQGGLTQPGELAVSPAGDLYVSSFTQNAVYRFDPAGAFKGTLAGLTLSGPRGLAFGADGLLYVSSASTNQILRYNPQTNAFLGVFGTVFRPAGLAFGPAGDLFVASAENNNVVRIDGTTGAGEGVFAAGNMSTPQSVVFGPGGDLLVHSQGTYDIVRFDGVTGAYEGTFYNGDYPYNPSAGLVFAPNGDLYTANLTGGAVNDNVWRFDGATGALETRFGPGNGSFQASGLALAPEPSAVALLAITAGTALLRRRPHAGAGR